jgi:hypothetical protein
MLQGTVPLEDEILIEKSRLFAEELEGWSLETISRAFRQHGRQSRFLPALSEILDQCREAQKLIAREQSEVQSLLSAPLVTDDERARNIERLKALKIRFNRRLQEVKKR